jgi:hypothetical protein
LKRFGSILDQLLTPRNQTWHRLVPSDPYLLEAERTVKLWFEEVNRAALQVSLCGDCELRVSESAELFVVSEPTERDLYVHRMQLDGSPMDFAIAIFISLEFISRRIIKASSIPRIDA